MPPCAVRTTNQVPAGLAPGSGGNLCCLIGRGRNVIRLISRKQHSCVKLLSVVFAYLLAAASTLAVPGRIVSTSPSITEVLFALGLGPHVVGVSNYCEYPPQVKELPKVGTFLRPDAESIARLKPDLVIVHKLPNDLANRLAALHIAYAEVDGGGLTDAYDEIRQIGEATGAKEQAEKLIATMHARLDQIRAQTARKTKPRVIFVIGRDPGTLSNLIVVGHDNFLDELIAVAGGVNIISEQSSQPYPHISLETILRNQPDVLIDMGDMGSGPEERERKAEENRVLWDAVPNLSAVKSNHVYCLTSTAFVVPGPRAVEAAEILFTLLQVEKPE
jgi:iron complex transport system substrate-binding protein